MKPSRYPDIHHFFCKTGAACTQSYLRKQLNMPTTALEKYLHAQKFEFK